MKKYEIIVSKIKSMVESGEIRQKKRLPSIRKMAELNNVNKSTVIKAYQVLEADHYIYSIPKGGYYLVDLMEESLGQQYEIDFSVTRPDERLLPYHEFAHCFNKAVDTYKHAIFLDADPAGLESLREVIINQLASQQVFGKLDNLVVTNGSQQAMNILVQMPFFDGREGILVEEPGYDSMIQLSEIHNRPIYTVKRTLDGIDLVALEEHFKSGKIKFFFTMPRFQNPLGTCLSEKMKMEIVRLAAEYKVYIVEDDCLIDLDYNKKCLPLYYYDSHDRVIFIKSYTKSFIPGIRLGVVLLPQVLRDRFIKYKYNADLFTSVFNQGALEIFIKSGLYEKHCDKIQKVYRKKMLMIGQFLKSHPKDGVRFVIPRSGVYMWFILDQKISVDTLFQNLLKEKVLIRDGRQYFENEAQYDNGFRICTYNLDDDSIKRGLSIILKEISRLNRYK
jgi:DNA-binding transcriptional MocR family regulator